MNRFRKQYGFTIIELMVVVSIIVLLLSLLIPVLQTARRVANTPRCLVAMRSGGLTIATYSNDHKNWLPSHVGWNTPSNVGWSAFDQRSNPSITANAGNHSNSDAMNLPYSSYITASSAWVLENKRPVNWGILIADGYVSDIKNTLFCPSRGYFQYDSPASSNANTLLNMGSYLANWVKNGEPVNNASLNLTIAASSSYNVYSYGTMDRVYAQTIPGYQWYQQDIRPNEFILSWEINGSVSRNAAQTGSGKAMTAGVGPTANNHQPGVSTLFFDNHATLVPDPSNYCERLSMLTPGGANGNGLIYDWLYNQLLARGNKVAHDGSFASDPAWRTTSDPGLDAMDNAVYYQPRYDANAQNNIYGQ